MQNLALQVSPIDDIVIHDTNGADARGRQIKCGRRPQAARAY